MDEHTLRVLEFDRLLELASEEALSEPGRVFCRQLRPVLDPGEAQRTWRLVGEAVTIIDAAGRPPLENFPELDGILSNLRLEGAVLRPRELVLVGRAVRISRLVKSFLRAQADRAPLLWEIAENLPVLSALEDNIDRSLGPEGEVLDTASSELGRIRREMIGLRGEIQNRLTQFMHAPQTRSALQDEIITRRGGRYVIPVRSSSRREVPGLVHDFSATGATAFVEPLEIVEDNNRLNLLRRREKQEIDRIFRRLSAMAAQAADQIAQAARLLPIIDSLFARAALSRRQRAAPPTLDPESLDLRRARHPLLLAREAETGRPTVPVDLLMSPETRVLVVSGINAGGKTVALKTLGLLAVMARAGFHLPMAQGGRLPFFDRVMAVVGDQQDLQQDLSTFSGHVRRLGRVLEQADEKSLVLLDELGTGTDPNEGAALALAVLEELRRKGAWVMTATHYHLLKAWAHLAEGASNVAVKTDSAGRPLFSLEYGTPGFSAGLTMARDLGLDPEVVARAESYLDQGHKKMLALLERLEEERALLAGRRAEIEMLQEELAAAAALVSAAEKKRQADSEAEMALLRRRINEAISRAERDFKEISRRLEDQDRERGRLIHKFHAVKSELRQQAGETRRPPALRPASSLHPGDRVYVRTLGREGQVKALAGAGGRVEVEIAGMKVQTDWTDLDRSEAGRSSGKPETRLILNSFSQAPRELNLLGLTVDEALPMVDKSIDQAQVGQVKSFSIIHGIGTGKLREAVRGFLAQDRRVKSFCPGSRRTGGDGITVVELAD